MTTPTLEESEQKRMEDPQYRCNYLRVILATLADAQCEDNERTGAKNSPELDLALRALVKTRPFHGF